MSFGRKVLQSGFLSRNLFLVGRNFVSWTFGSPDPIDVFPEPAGIASMTLARHTLLDHVNFGIPSSTSPLFAQLRDLMIPLHHILTFRSFNMLRI
jgi:hypothetical protein